MLAEEFLKHKIPSIVIDTQGEMVHLDQFSKDAIVVEDMKFRSLLARLRARKTVVLNFQGLSYVTKTERCHEILAKLREAKEKDYQEVNSDVRLLKIPPVIVNMDEAEIYAPHDKPTSEECRDCIIEIAKRGGKHGIGLIVGTQRLPGLHHEVKSQCNSAIVFHVTDEPSRNALRRLPYITGLDLGVVRNLSRGECIITGEMVSQPVVVGVRDIETPRAKSLDFEGMLGLIQLQSKISN